MLQSPWSEDQGLTELQDVTADILLCPASSLALEGQGQNIGYPLSLLIFGLGTYCLDFSGGDVLHTGAACLPWSWTALWFWQAQIYHQSPGSATPYKGRLFRGGEVTFTRKPSKEKESSWDWVCGSGYTTLWFLWTLLQAPGPWNQGCKTQVQPLPIAVSEQWSKSWMPVLWNSAMLLWRIRSYEQCLAGVLSGRCPNTYKVTYVWWWKLKTNL